MQIQFSPVRSDRLLTVSRAGDTLTINDEAFDFSGIPDGATLPRDAVACEWLASDVERDGGELRLTLVLPHGPAAPEATLFPMQVTLSGDGPVELPTHSIEPESHHAEY